VGASLRVDVGDGALEVDVPDATLRATVGL